MSLSIFDEMLIHHFNQNLSQSLGLMRLLLIVIVSD